MMGRALSHRASREVLERDTIRLLCSDLIQAETRTQLAALLKGNVFEDQLNRVVYETIVAVGAVPARRLRELLPGLVTNLGFPDFDLREYLGRNASSGDNIDMLFESLLELSEARPEEGKKAMGQSA